MFWLVVGLGAPAVLAISLTVFPERVITLQGRLYRKYYHVIGLSIDEIDRGFQLPADRLMQSTPYIVTAIVLLVAMDTCILAVCDQRTQKNQVIGFRCRSKLLLWDLHWF